MQSVNPENLQTSIAKIYQTFGLTEDKAALLADTLVMADLWGHSSHGVMRTSWYAARLKSRVMDPFAELEIKTDTGPLLAIDGHNGIGQYITNEAVDLVAARAKTYGIACASIARSGHFGTAMYYTKRLADKNMIGFLATNASPAMAPCGGAEKLVGNNPQSWSAPTALDAPFILDIAHTEVARGKIYLAKEKKEPIPDHWALNKDGMPTTNPSEAILGTLLPMAGHKGFGLSAMMDILSGILSGSAFGTSVNGPYVPDQPSGVGHFLCAINIAQLRRVEAFTEDMQQMIARWKASRKQADIAEIFYPGEKEYLHYEKCKKQGLKLAEETVINLHALAESCGLRLQL